PQGGAPVVGDGTVGRRAAAVLEPHAGGNVVADEVGRSPRPHEGVGHGRGPRRQQARSHGGARQHPKNPCSRHLAVGYDISIPTAISELSGPLGSPRTVATPVRSRDHLIGPAADAFFLGPGATILVTAGLLTLRALGP